MRLSQRGGASGQMRGLGGKLVGNCWIQLELALLGWAVMRKLMKMTFAKNPRGIWAVKGGFAQVVAQPFRE